MSNGVDYINISDFTNHALAEFYERPKVQFTAALQEYTIYNWLFKEQSLRVASGDQLEWRFIRTNDDEATASAPFQLFPIEHADQFSKGISPWTQFQSVAVWNEQIMNNMKGAAELADYGQAQVFVPVRQMLNSLENSAFRVKANSSDTRTPDGIPFWFPKLGVGVEDTTGGFNGTTGVYSDGTTTTTIGNTDRSTVPVARTANGTYNGMNTGALDTLRHLQNITMFNPPTEFSQYISQSQPKWRLLSSFSVQEAYEALVNAGPDLRQGDANPFSGTVTFRGMKWEKVAAMNSLADSPIYGINSSLFFPWRSSKMWMYWTPVDTKQGDPFTHYKHLFCQFNFAAVNERPAGFCLHKVRTV